MEHQGVEPAEGDEEVEENPKPIMKIELNDEVLFPELFDDELPSSGMSPQKERALGLGNVHPVPATGEEKKEEEKDEQPIAPAKKLDVDVDFPELDDDAFP